MLGCSGGVPWWITPHRPTDMSLSQARKLLTKPGEAVQTHIAQLLWNSMVWFLSPDILGLLGIFLVWCDGRLLGSHRPANVGLRGLALRLWSFHTNGVTEGSKGTYSTCHSMFFLILTRHMCLSLTCLSAQCPGEDLGSHMLILTLQGSLLPAFQQAEQSTPYCWSPALLDQAPSSLQGESMVSGQTRMMQSSQAGLLPGISCWLNERGKDSRERHSRYCLKAH